MHARLLLSYVLALALLLGLAPTSRSATGSLEPGVGAGHGNREGPESPAETRATIYAAPAAPPVVSSFAPRPTRIAATYTVTTTADTGAGSLGAAVQSANASPDLDVIAFNLSGGGVHTLFPKGMITLTQPVIFDGTTQPGWSGSPLIELDGSLAGADANGIMVTGGGSTISGFIINRYKTTGTGGYGIKLDVNGFNTITNCWIGTNAAGTGRAGNQVGGIVVLGNSGDNQIGGTAAAQRNIISGNPGSGIHLATGNAGRNVIRGNWIGLSVTGDTLANGGNGIFLNSTNNTIGGTAAGARNVISGNGYPGIYIANAATGTIVQGNYIGTDPTGQLDRGNLQNGIDFDFASNCTIGGNTPAARNVISGNDFPNVYVLGPCSGNKIQGNYIGTDSQGLFGLGDGNGVVIDNASNNLVGGGGAGEGNVVSGHPFPAVVIQNAGATGNKVQGNRIGTNAAGNVAVPNTRGVVVVNAARNVIGGSAAGEGNLISGNDLTGVDLRASNNCRVSGNQIGTDTTGLLDVGNKLHGIIIFASNDTVGGTSDAFGNTVAFNGAAGIYDSTGTGNLFRFNKTYGNKALGIDLYPRGIVANDSLDNDAGANGQQNFVIFDSTAVIGTSLHLYGRLDSKPGTSYVVDIFVNTEADTAHFGEGRGYIGSVNVTTNAAGRALFDYNAGPTSDALFVTATATDAAGNSSEYSQTTCLADHDQDGIPDCNETPGWPTDINSDGKYELDLYARGARPDSIDIFVEIDAINGYAPPAGMIPMVKAAFSGLPKAYLNAPPVVNGIAIHSETSHLNISDMPPNFTHEWVEFHAVRAKYFGNPNERSNPDALNILHAKSLYFRYCIFPRTFWTPPTPPDPNDSTYSGDSEGYDLTGGDEFMVTFGSLGDQGWNNTQDLRTHAGTYMHELGHTLGLPHGGDAGAELYKPNYYSVMNYTWQTPNEFWQKPGTWRLDYSRAALTTLNEANLDEHVGLGAPVGVWPPTLMPFSDPNGQTRWALLSPGKSVDWDHDGQITAGTFVDLNFYADSSGTISTFAGAKDWDHLIVNFRKSPWYNPDNWFNPLVAKNRELNDAPEPLRELTPAIRDRLNSLPPPQPEGIFVMDGQRDPSSALVASNAGMNLYAAYRDSPLGGQLYVAADGAQAGRDMAILVAKTPGVLKASPLGKAGSVAAWDALLARRGSANTAEWQDADGTVFQPLVVDSTGTFMEGVALLDVLLGEKPQTFSVALAAWNSATGGALVAQAPNGNGNGNVEAGEWIVMASSNVGVPGVVEPGAGLGVRLSNAHPNPSISGSSVRLSLPAAADVVATVQDVAGRVVATLEHKRMQAGEHVIAWNPGANGERKPAAGVYFIVVRALGEQRSSRVILLP
jgi:hypothetical protein